MPARLRSAKRFALACLAIALMTLPWAPSAKNAGGAYRIGSFHWGSAAWAEEGETKPPKPKNGATSKASLDERSLEFRARLQQYPTQDALFARLLDMYQKEGKVDVLVSMYRQHTNVYPNDMAGRVVYVRLLTSINDPEAANQVRDAIKIFPKQGFLHYLLYQSLKESGDPKAIDALDKAVEHGTDPRVTSKWIEELLKLALQDDRRDVAERHVGTMIQLQGPRAEGKVRAARRLAAFGLHEKALTVLKEATTVDPSPETIIDIEMLSAASELSLRKTAEARKRLDALLARLTADHWRRTEVLTMRQRLIGSSDERDTMLEEARAAVKADPHRDTIALDLARMLRGFDRHREALTVLVEASKRIPESAQLEKETLAVFDHLGDERRRVAYLDERIAKYPTRDDLVDRRVRSLYLLRRTKEAGERFNSILEGLSKEQTVPRLLDMARFLRANNRPKPSTAMFLRALDLAPAKAAVIRELGEMLQAQRDRGALRQLLVRPISDQVGDDEFLDLINFMIEAGHYRQAETSLGIRHAKNPEQFAVGLSLLRVQGYLGRFRTGTALTLKLRRLADTPARYRRWINLATEFAAAYAESRTFLEGEQVRLAQETGPWSSARVDRIAAFLDASARRYRIAEARALVEELLATNVPHRLALQLRRHLALHLESSSRNAVLAGHTLEMLIEDDSENQEEYRARLALVHLADRDFVRAETLLDKLKISKIQNADILSRLVRPYRQLEDHDRLLKLYERLTAAEPHRRSNWERQVTALLATGDETRLRSTLRRLLRGIPRMPVADETRVLLRNHLSDSYWRTISSYFKQDGDGEIVQALGALDQAERLYPPRQRPLWQSWARIYALGRLGRTKARDDTLLALREVRKQREDANASAKTRTKTVAAAKSKEGDSQSAPDSELATSHSKPTWIPFPDGMAASWRGLERMSAMDERRVESEDVAEGSHKGDRSGPDGADQVRWVFDLGGAKPLALKPFGKDRLLVGSSAGKLHCLDRISGKLCWTLDDTFSASSTITTLEGALVAIVRGPHIECYDAKGAMKWRMTADQGPLHIAEGPKGLIAFDSHTEEILCLDPVTGKVNWWRELGSVADGAHAANAGLSVSDGHILAFGKHTFVLDAETGEHLWKFDPTRVRSVPVDLKEPKNERRARRSLGGWSSFFGGGGSGYSPSAPIYSSPVSSGGFSSSSSSFPMGGGPSFGASAAGCGGSCGSSCGGGSASPSGSAIFFPPSGGIPIGWTPSSTNQTLHPVNSVAHWGSPLAADEKRVAILNDGMLLLLRDRNKLGSKPTGTMTVANLRHPFKTHLRSVLPGTFLGRHRGRLVFVNEKGITHVRPDTGTRKTIDIDADLGRKLPIRATLQGGYCYLAGDERILTVHLDSGNVIGDVPWPARLTKHDEPNEEEEDDRGPWRTRKKAPEIMLRYLFRGVVDVGGVAQSRLAAAQQARIMRSRRGYRPFIQQAAQAAQRPSASSVHPASVHVIAADSTTLYTTRTFGELVALDTTPRGAPKKDESASGGSSSD